MKSYVPLITITAALAVGWMSAAAGTSGQENKGAGPGGEKGATGKTAATCPAGPQAQEQPTAGDPQRTVVVAVVQAGFKHSAKTNPGMEANFNLLADMARQAAKSEPRPELICYPEFAISGWPYPNEARINTLAETIPGDGPWYRRYHDLAREINTALLCWLVESTNGKLYNVGFILDAQGNFRGKYRKVHANHGEQVWWGWSQGDRFEVIELDGIRYGISICMDMFMPETVRCLELLGADVVLHMSIGDDMSLVVPARAFDGRMPIVMSIFRGGSYAVDDEGKLLGKLSADDTGWKSFTLYPFRPHRGHKYGGIWDIKKGFQNVRNLAAYAPLVDPKLRPPWTEVFMDEQGRPQNRQQLLKRFNGRYDAKDP